MKRLIFLYSFEVRQLLVHEVGGACKLVQETGKNENIAEVCVTYVFFSF